MPDLHLLSPAGFRAAGVYAGIKTKHVPDVGLLVCDAPSPTAAAVFTANKVFAAPVKIGREHLAESGGRIRAVVVNAGNANACTGRQGDKDARRMCQVAADFADCQDWEVLPSSTGIIGRLMPMEKVERGIAAAGESLGDSAEHALRFADAILTTDTKRKSAAAALRIGRQTVTLAGVCKGSGMIGPRLATKAKHATMLAYLTTDAKVPRALLASLLQDAADDSFNAVTVDDHASTNDTAAILASGASGVALGGRAEARKFADALREVCQSLAYQIAADGEGATKVVAVRVRGAASDADAKLIARAVANSPLVKCAMHGNDPNWGRIVSAAGFSGAEFDPGKCTLTLQGTVVFRNGQPVPFEDAAVSESLKAKEVVAELNCRLGKAEATCWTCDLSKDYVTINADYHT